MQVKIWNDSDKEYSEEFRGKMLVIPARGFIEMGRSEGNKFLGQAVPVRMGGNGRQQNPKALRMEKPAEEFAEMTGQPLKFTARDGKQFRTEKGLAEHEATLPEGLKDESGPRQRRKVQTAG
jgi:hypothetical protein